MYLVGGLIKNNMEKNIKLLVLTDINVSNVHLMIASILDSYPLWDVKFVNINLPNSSFDNSRWYDYGKEDIDISYLYNKQNKFVKALSLMKLIRNFDIVFCTGAVASLVKLCNKPYIYFCTGSDLDQYAQYGCCSFEYIDKNISIFRKLLRPVKKEVYKKAIKCSEISIIAPYQYKNISSLGYNNLGFFPHPLQDDYLNININDKQSYIEDVRRELNCKWILFSSTRHVWDESLINESDYKGNNVIIEAFNLFLMKTKRKDTKLVFIEKGPDVLKTKRLIQELNIERFIIWLKPMNRSKLIYYYLGSHLCFDEFSRGCLAFCSIEAMACGTPVISYIGDNEPNMPFYQPLPPILNTKDPKTISFYIEEILNNETILEKNQKAAYSWVINNCSRDSLNEAFLKMASDILYM